MMTANVSQRAAAFLLFSRGKSLPDRMLFYILIAYFLACVPAHFVCKPVIDPDASPVIEDKRYGGLLARHKALAAVVGLYQVGYFVQHSITPP